MTAAIRDAALAAGSIGFLISDYVEERFDLPPIAVLDLGVYSPEQQAAPYGRNGGWEKSRFPT